LYTEAWAAAADSQRLLPALNLATEGAWPVSEGVLAACAGTQTPQGVIAAVPFVQIQPRLGLILILDRLRDPGNLGTILRSAEAAGIGQVVLTPGSVDPYNPKVVRGAMGAHFRLPVASLDWPAIIERLTGRAVWLADATGETPYDSVDWRRPSALIVGGETTGASPEASGIATGGVSIPMAEGTESINAAMAATVLLFEAARQNRCGAARKP
jgi:TrmH family RNA methyltransferase